MPFVFTIQPGQSVEERPRVVLIRWRAMMTDSGEVHLVGYALETARGRVSTPVQSLDPQARTAITASGRVYVLEGAPGGEPTAVQLWAECARIDGITRWCEVTQEIAQYLDGSMSRVTLAEVLAAMPDVGRDEDLERRDDTREEP